MAMFIVTYDLHEQGQNYECLHEKLNAYPVHWNIQRSVWLIETAETAEQICKSLLDCLDSNDKIVVMTLGKPAAWYGYSEDVSSWLKDHL